MMLLRLVQELIKALTRLPCLLRRFFLLLFPVFTRGVEAILQVRVRSNLESPGQIDRDVESFTVGWLVFGLGHHRTIWQHHVSLLLYVLFIAPVDSIEADLCHLESFKSCIVVRISILLTASIIDALKLTQRHALGARHPI